MYLRLILASLNKNHYTFFILYSSAPVIEISVISTFILVRFYAEFTCRRAWRPVHCSMHVTNSAIPLHVVTCTSRALPSRYDKSSYLGCGFRSSRWDILYMREYSYSLLYHLYNMYNIALRATQHFARNRFVNRANIWSFNHMFWSKQ